jgi:hypothetical protein
VALTIPVYRAAEADCPGRKPVVPEWVIAVKIMAAVMLKKKTKSARHVWWREHAADFARWFPGQPLPDRST